jgi:hypothetical protein
VIACQSETLSRSAGNRPRVSRLRMNLLLIFLLSCVPNQGCMQRMSGYALQGQLRIGWCAVDQILRIDSQSLGRILSQRCVSAPMLPVAVHCQPSEGLTSTLALQSLVDDKLKVVIESYELVTSNGTVRARPESNVRACSPSYLPAHGAQMLTFNFADGTRARSGELVIRGFVEPATGMRQDFACKAQVTQSKGAWEWINPLVTLD